ncbi:hypothetical protein VOLCADRAFT_99498 [Volvox carteri f. nagariensis]|uniref:Uncharacterized protein n=1 Tax=Volvox carteri f. nagariensis TaxID=3068 RepID=D8UHY0_VOLCA|nr:uncharacterized protein VOLCADRAFT_99498 [Volvox carteri f. nagariensis]EFJ40661.1 hypothetical protein VOLCADRAFT_99498 [Volvox carteri f. nagariensis]|eukprot:XP_002958287.1 hypothetical protein VOLCADRAFT_99498 [Volvox carteri f. nagariensis]
MPPKMARQSQVPPQTLSPVNLGAYGTPSPSLPSGSSAGAAAKPPVNIADLWAQLAAVSPTGGGRDRSSPAGVPRRPLTFKQQLLLGSMGCHDEDVLHAKHTNAESNMLLAEGRKYRDEFQAQHGAKPASSKTSYLAAHCSLAPAAGPRARFPTARPQGNLNLGLILRSYIIAKDRRDVACAHAVAVVLFLFFWLWFLLFLYTRARRHDCMYIAPCAKRPVTRFD